MNANCNYIRVILYKYSLEFNIEALIFLFHNEMAHRWRGVAFIINCLKARMWIDSLKWKSGAIRLNKIQRAH